MGSVDILVHPCANSHRKMMKSLGLMVLGSLGLSAAAPQRQAPDFRASVGAGFNGDASLAKIIAEQRFIVDGGNKFGHAAHQEDGTVTMEEATGRNSRIGAYSYIGDDGKTYTVKYEAGVNGFRILSGDHIPSGGQTAAAAVIDQETGEPEEYDYEYYDEVDPETSPFVNPFDRTHQSSQALLAGNLAGHLAGALERQRQFDPVTEAPLDRSNPLLVDALATTPRSRFFPNGQIKLDRFVDGFNFNFKSN